MALTLFACTTVSSAHQLPPATSAPSPTLRTAKEYSSSEGRFKVLFPSCTLNEIHETPDSKLGKVAFQDGYPGRFLVLEFSNNQIYRRKMVVVKNRVYIITATAPKDHPKLGNNQGKSRPPYQSLFSRAMPSKRSVAIAARIASGSQMSGISFLRPTNAG